MEILVCRKWKKDDYTIGRISLDGVLFGNTLEDTDRGLDEGMQDYMIRSKKIPTRTAIPTGRYIVDMETVSSRFSKYPFYMEVCQGKLPRLKNVRGFDGILIHCGTNHQHTEGCILVGLNKKVGQLEDGKEIFKKIYAEMKEAHDRGETIYITIE
jgi:hypothetical protein